MAEQRAALRIRNDKNITNAVWVWIALAELPSKIGLPSSKMYIIRYLYHIRKRQTQSSLSKVVPSVVGRGKLPSNWMGFLPLHADDAFA